MFDDYAKKLKELQQDVPKIFERVAKKGAIKFVNIAKDRTDKEHLVDTGNYKRSWSAKATKPLKNTYAIECENSANYASFLERGTGRGIKGRFVGELSLEDTRFYCIEQLETALEKAYKKK